MPRIAARLRLRDDANDDARHSIVDPCAGDGAALVELRNELARQSGRSPISVEARAERIRLYAVELEEQRFYRCRHNVEPHAFWSASSSYIVRGDAFHVEWDSAAGGASCLLLNPPYDVEARRDGGRTEARFLARWTEALAFAGVLVLVLPHYALPACAPTLAQHFEKLLCLRFPEADFGAFRQVVLFARRRSPLREPDPRIVATVEAWGAAPPAEDLDGPVSSHFELPTTSLSPLGSLRVRELDLRGLLAQHRPWHATTPAGRLEPLEGVLPRSAGPRSWPMLMPPRPAHIAAAMTAGAFDGAAVSAPGMPSLLVRALFGKDFTEVGERSAKDGTRISVQAERPRLVIRALDLETGTLSTLRSEPKVSGAREVAAMTAGDLIAHYGADLLRTLRLHCPVQHDPARDSRVALASSVARTLYGAQHDAVSAVVRRLCDGTRELRPKSSVVVLGEIGCGKSTVALASAASAGATRILVVCPPHLLEGWARETAAVLLGFRCVVLRKPEDVDALPSAPFVALLSREAAKLGYGIAGIVSSRCPRCAAPITEPPEVLARRRARCARRVLSPGNYVARLAQGLARALAMAAPSHGLVRELVCAPALLRAMDQRCARHAAAEKSDSPEEPTRVAALEHEDDVRALERARGFVRRILWLAIFSREPSLRYSALRLAARLLDATGDEEQRRDVVRWLVAGELLGEAPRSFHEVRARSFASYLGFEDLDWLLPEVPASAVAMRLALSTPFLAARGEHREHPRPERMEDRLDAALSVLEELRREALWEEEEPCGEPLFQATAPARIALARYITREHPRAFDLLVLDEAHEYSGDGTAQTHAAGRLHRLGLPSIELTGSANNGYADSLFELLWRVSPEFRQDFPRERRGEFARLYGYLKREVRDDEGAPLERGSHSDRVVNAKTSGFAPGVLPIVLLRYLLAHAVTLQQSDLEADIPPKSIQLVRVAPSVEQSMAYERMLFALKREMKASRFDARKSGKLLGAIAHFVTFLDRCTSDTGNVEGGGYRIAYPHGEVVCEARGLCADQLLPKEEELVRLARAELAEDRWSMVLVWNQDLAPRLTRILERELGEPVALLDASKVDAAAREPWIRHHCLGEPRTAQRRRRGALSEVEVPGQLARVLVVNGAAIETGLNCLVRAPNGRGYCTQFWMQSPYRATSIRQAEGRIHRVGQTWPARVYRLFYGGTLQEKAIELIAEKIRVAQGVDGVSPETVLLAAGIGGDDGMGADDFGGALWRLLEQEVA